MTTRLTRTTHGTRTSEVGVEVDDAGHARAWQTSGHRVGTFARDLTPAERTALADASRAARDADAPAVDGGPSASREQLVADGMPDVVLDGQASAPAGFADLVGVLRRLRTDLADDPVAAIELDVHDGAAVRHVGTSPVVVRLGASLSVEVTVFDADSAIADQTTHPVDVDPLHGPVGPGWELPLVADLGVRDRPGDGFVTVRVGPVEVDALGDGVLRATELTWSDG